MVTCACAFCAANEPQPGLPQLVRTEVVPGPTAAVMVYVAATALA